MIPPPNSGDAQSIKKHHSSDRYYQLYKIDFPYTLGIVKNLYYRVNSKAFDVVALEPRGRAFTVKEVALKQTMLMKMVADAASARGYKVGFVFYPTPDDAYNNSKQYESFLNALPGILKSSEHVFTIDLLPYLYDGSKLEGRALRAPHGHFDSAGNAIIGNAIYAEIVGKSREF